MHVWRINRAIHNPLDGEGARLYGARWNRKGIPVVYTGRNPSLSVLEMLVHVDPEQVPGDLYLFKIEVPETLDVLQVNEKKLPDDWKQNQPACLRYLESLPWENFAAIEVPSAIINHEVNLILNPRHNSFSSIQLSGRWHFQFDARLPGFRNTEPA